jgi:NADH:ubiquinone oxidoreductase subunit K
MLLHSTTQLFCLSVFIFVISLFIILRKENFLIILLSIEIGILSAILIFIVTGIYHSDSKSFVYVPMIIVISTAETAVGLSLAVKIYRTSGTLIIRNFGKFKY